MKTEEIKVCILRIEGTNCEQEMYEAFKTLGALPELVHLKQLTGDDVYPQEKRKLSNYQILMLPGGFSSGDYIRAGAIFAARMKAALAEELADFVKQGYPVGGICNGFQILVELGLLPGFDGEMTPKPEAVLATNDSSRFECRPTQLKHENGGNCVFTRKLSPGQVILAPSAHAEGKLLFPAGQEDEFIKRLIASDQLVFRYVDWSGNYAGYPYNPNGSTYNIAGICNREGNVFGMMPHPERVISIHTHNDWTRSQARKGIDGGSGEDPANGDGRAIFQSVLDYVAGKF